MTLDWAKDYLQICILAGLPVGFCILLFFSLIWVINYNSVLGWPIIVVESFAFMYPIFYVLRKREKRRIADFMEGEDNKKFLSPGEAEELVDHLFPKKKTDS